jgi:hypothetical protein
MIPKYFCRKGNSKVQPPGLPDEAEIGSQENKLPVLSGDGPWLKLLQKTNDTSPAFVYKCTAFKAETNAYFSQGVFSCTAARILKKASN